MAINLFCYSSCSKAEAQSLIDAIEKTHPDLFFKKFDVSTANNMDEKHCEIVRDFNFVAHSFFLILLADKNAVSEIDRVAFVMKERFGDENLIVLFENERLM